LLIHWVFLLQMEACETSIEDLMMGGAGDLRLAVHLEDLNGATVELGVCLGQMGRNRPPLHSD
jgi:hypothetical protein